MKKYPEKALLKKTISIKILLNSDLPRIFDHNLIKKIPIDTLIEKFRPFKKHVIKSYDHKINNKKVNTFNKININTLILSYKVKTTDNACK